MIYFFVDFDRPIFLLFMYAKYAEKNLDADEKKAVREFANRIKRGKARE